MKNYKIAVAGTGYVGLSLSVLLAQHNQVTAVDIVQAKVDMINNHRSPIQDDYILPWAVPGIAPEAISMSGGEQVSPGLRTMPYCGKSLWPLMLA